MNFRRRVWITGCLAWVCAASVPGQTRPVLQATPSPAQTAPAPASSAPAQAAAPAADGQPAQVSSGTYIIGPGDVLQMSVWKEPAMSAGSVPVRPDGEITLPAQLGDIPAAGVTPMALSQDIATRMKKYLTEPLVTVTVVSVAPKQIYMIGEIAHTGPVVLTPDMTVLQAIAAGGGLSPYAKTKLYILRKGKGKETKIPFDYKKALKSGDQQGVALVPGDTIVVP